MLPRPLLSLLILFSFFFILHTTNSHFLSLDCFHISFNFLRIHFFSLFRSLLSPLPPHSSSCYNHILLAHFTWNPNHSHSNKKKTATTKYSIISMFIFRFFFCGCFVCTMYIYSVFCLCSCIFSNSIDFVDLLGLSMNMFFDWMHIHSHTCRTYWLGCDLVVPMPLHHMHVSSFIRILYPSRKPTK